MKWSDFSKNKLVVLDFWATWCIPCMEALPSTVKLSADLARQQVGLIFISFDNNKAYWAKMSEQLHLPNSFIIDEKNKQYLAENLNLHTIPRYILINSNGDVLDYDTPKPGTDDFTRLIKSILDTD